MPEPYRKCIAVLQYCRAGLDVSGAPQKKRKKVALALKTLQLRYKAMLWAEAKVLTVFK